MTTVPVPESTLSDTLQELQLLVGEGDETDDAVVRLCAGLEYLLERADESTHAVECRQCGTLDQYGDDGALTCEKAHRMAGLHEGLETRHDVEVVSLGP
jgi:hypothetical protein